MLQKITNREHQILLLASHGHTDKAIAAELGISARTVGTYWERLRGKVDGTSRTEIVMKVLATELQVALQVANEAMSARDFLLQSAENYAVFRIAPDRILNEWNPGVRRVLGYGCNEFEGKPFSMLFTAEDIEDGKPEHEMSEASKHGHHAESGYHVRKDGSLMWVDGTLAAIRDEVGKVRYFLKIMRDDSERKNMEEELARLRKRLTAI